MLTVFINVHLEKAIDIIFNKIYLTRSTLEEIHW